MDLSLSTAELAFRDEVRALLAQALPAEMRARGLAGESQIGDTRAWQRILHAHGWGAPGWPPQFGGRGLDATRQYLFELECALAGAPPQLPFGLKMVGPVIMRFGSPEQQRQFLPRIVSGEDWWCQGYSEPGAGSDLASLRTAAVRDGEHYVINGQKAWNSYGHLADWMFCLVRTDTQAKAQRGISFLLIDMRSPGISVRATRLLDASHEVNEVFFQDVRVPVGNRVGAENEGWTSAKFLLTHERAGIAGIGPSRRMLERVKQAAGVAGPSGHVLLEDPRFRARLAELDIQLRALELTNLRLLCGDRIRGEAGLGPSVLKIRGTEILQGISELLLEAQGRAALALHPGGATAAYLNLRKLSIFGGSNEIQKNIITQLLRL